MTMGQSIHRGKEGRIADTKRAYYDALNRRHRALRALAQETNQ